MVTERLIMERKAITFSLNDLEIERLNSLTYENKFGTNRSAYIRSLIERAWEEHEAKEGEGK